MGSNSLLAMYRPDLLHLPTTNGEHCTGDAIKMGEAIGAKTIDLEWVQVHPTGLVKPDDPDAKVKFLAAEALRGVGGLVFSADGKRFANELGRRDYVTGEMWKNKPPFRLVLNKAASDEIMWHCKHYTGRGVMKYYETGAKLAEDMGVPLQTLVDETEKHYQAAKKTEKDPDGGSWPAYPSGKSWDEPSGKTGSGKKFYHNIISGAEVATQPFYVAIITPVIHLHGRLGNDRAWRVREERQALAGPLRCWRGRWRCSWQQPPWRQLSARLRRLRPGRRTQLREVHVRGRWEVQALPDRRRGQVCVQYRHHLSTPSVLSEGTVKPDA